MKKQLLSIVILFSAAFGAESHAALTAAFTSQEASVAYYSQGWDNSADANSWSYEESAASENYWTVVESPYENNATAFSSIDPASRYSLCLEYDYSHEQSARATSPAIEIRPNTTLEFYSYSTPIFLIDGRWKLYTIEDETKTLLIDQFQWHQTKVPGDVARWERIWADLSEFNGKTIKFQFEYTGIGGESAAIDGFRLIHSDDSEESKISIFCSESVHFVNQSTDATEYEWTFEGGTPATSIEKNPVVTYNEAGTFSVKLIAKNGEETKEFVRTDYIKAIMQAPKAKVAISGGYFSPYCTRFVPVGGQLTFSDASEGVVDERQWFFNHTDITSSTEKEQTVTYTQGGLASYALKVSNGTGYDIHQADLAINVGGAQYVWNISSEEKEEEVQYATSLEYGLYGYYGGSNWLGLSHFAEHFDAPQADATIDSVAIFFDVTDYDTDTMITLTINAEDENGMPGRELGRSQLHVSALKSDPNNFVQTTFHLEKTAEIGQNPFFVTISGFPNVGYNDNIAMIVLRRNIGDRTTAYHFALDYDEETDAYLETGKWNKQTDDPCSFLISPVITYDKITAIETVETDEVCLMQIANNVVELQAEVDRLKIYNATGCLVQIVENPASHIELNSLAQGVYIVRAEQGNHSQTTKALIVNSKK